MGSEGAKVGPGCQKCRGSLVFDAAVGYLRCQRCGSLQEVDVEGLIGDHALDAALAAPRARGPIGCGSRQVICGDCQAEVELPDEAPASCCELCGAALLGQHEAKTDHDLPEALVPFVIDRRQAERLFQKWLSQLWLRPHSLQKAASLHELHGIYIPYWAFGCEVTSSWQADAGYRQPSRQPTGQPKTRWEPCGGQRHDRYQDELVCASRGLAADCSGAAQHFDTSGLMPYASEYLLGFSAERYAIDPGAAWHTARRTIGHSQERRCAADVPGDRQRSLRASHTFAAVRFAHVLLPMWIAAYRYRGRLHRFIINGQTGEVSGQAPLSAGKLGLLLAIAVALLFALVLLLHSRPLLPPLVPLAAIGRCADLAGSI